MSDQIQYWVTVWDKVPKRWPAASKLVGVGVPLAQARRYQIIRREMTAGLRRKVKKAVN